MPMTDHDLGRRIESAWADTAVACVQSYAASRPEAEAQWLRLAEGTAVSYGPDSPVSAMLSQAQGLGFAGPVAPDELERLEQFYRERGVSHGVEVSTLANPGLLPALAARGYRPTEVTHVLTRPLEPGFEDMPADMAEGQGPIVTRVTESDREIAARTVLHGFFEGPGDPPEEMAEIMTALNSSPVSSTWLARIGESPAGGATLLVQPGLALFAGDSTLPGFRRKGVQSALIAARLAEARRLGCELAVVCTSPGSPSQRNYERQGFRMAYARVLMSRTFGGETAGGD